MDMYKENERNKIKILLRLMLRYDTISLSDNNQTHCAVYCTITAFHFEVVIMKPNAFIAWILLSLILIAGCSDTSIQTTDSDAMVSELPQNSISITAPCTSIQETHIPELPEKPVLSLHAEPGSYRLKYVDINTSEYLEYYLYIPENAVIGMPMIIFLHGDGEVGQLESLENYGMISQAREIYGDEFPFIAVSPCTQIPTWTDNHIPETLMGLIENVAATYSVDQQQIIITGHSRGAMGVWYLISTYGDYFSAAVPVSCGTDKYLDYSNLCSVPILAFAGTSGEAENIYQQAMRTIVDNIIQAGGNAQLILLEGSEHKDTSKDAYTEETFRWMLEKRG